jgi:hypothetical protein
MSRIDGESFHPAYDVGTHESTLLVFVRASQSLRLVIVGGLADFSNQKLQLGGELNVVVW